MDKNQKSSTSYAYGANEQKYLPNETKTVANTRIQHLNDDCLLEIFSLKSLTLKDLYSLAGTCERFQELTQRVFPKRLSYEQSWDGVCLVESGKGSRQILANGDVERLFQKFGSILTQVSIEIRSDWYERPDCNWLSLIAENCSSLKKLDIVGFNIPEIRTVELKPVFKQLQLLDLKFVSIEDKILFAECNSLVELIVHCVENCDVILDNIFPKLQRFTYWTSEIVIADSVLNSVNVRSLGNLLTFISHHTTLKALDLCFFCEEECSATILQAIGNCCRELNELRLGIGLKMYFDNRTPQPLQLSKTLRTLALTEMMGEHFQFLSCLYELRELHLRNCILPTDEHFFDFAPCLTKMEVEYCESSGEVFDVFNMISRLADLEELTILALRTRQSNTRFVLDEETFRRIVSVVKDRPNGLTLRCETNFILKKCEENQKVVLVPVDI